MTGDLVDVFDVPGGSACGCVCPSCGDQLIARHGSINQWHFAHASRGIAEGVKDACEYSFFVSVRLMARQMVNQSLNIMLPEFTSQVSHVDENTGEILTVEFSVAEQKTVTLLDVLPEKRVGDVLVDLIGKIGEYVLAIYFTHPGRAAPLDSRIPAYEKCGVIEVSLSNVYTHIVAAKSKNDSYSSALKRFLETDIRSKKWLHHPRFTRKRQEAEIELHNKLSVARSQRPAEINFSCGKCGHAWVAPASKSKCVNCNSHLYSFRNEKT